MNYDYWRYYLRGWMMHFMNRPLPAYEAYAEAFRHNPQSMQAALSLGFIAASQKRFPEAVKWFRDATRIDRESTEAWFNLGFVLEEAGQRDEAITAFRETTRLNPAHDRAWYGMGLALAKTGDHPAAAQAFREAANLQPMNGYAWYQLAMAHHHANQPDEVKKIILHLKDFEPKFCRQLIRDAGRSDLEAVLKELPV